MISSCFSSSVTMITALLRCIIIMIFVHKSQGVDGNGALVKNHIEWENLESRLSTDATFTPTDLDDWIDQCIVPFVNAVPVTLVPVSNYNLYTKPSGLCMDIASCAYQKCLGPLYYDPSFFREQFMDSLGIPHYNILPLSEEQSDELKSSTELNLPVTVVHPKHVGDVSETIKFAIANRQSIEGISVKTSGHSYTGSSTKESTILLNMSKFTKYTHTDEANFVFNPESLVECQFESDMSDAFRDACRLAIARNKPAVLRVGGGQIWDQALRAVDITWNTELNRPRKYHIVSGAAGTVSAAGGWVQSGGLSGTNGMRMFGYGVDQVLHIEMVLPDGRHVRFGPSSWVHDSNFMYPQTKHVKGFCNTGDLSDESAWNWSECEEGSVPNFNDLWFAVRGGGGGAFGVVTSIYYQLHDAPQFNSFKVTVNFDADDKNSYKAWTEFLLRFLFIPESIGVTKNASNDCGHPDSAGIKGGGLFCYNGAGDVMQAAWSRFFVDGNASQVVWTETGNGAYSLTRLNSDGYVGDIPYAAVTSYYVTHGGEHFPLSIVSNEDKIDELVDLLVSCVHVGACYDVGFYLTGGNAAIASDGMDALPSFRRNNGFMQIVYNETYITLFKKLFYDVEDDEPVSGDEFPGCICHNHASLREVTPQRNDWTKQCNSSWSQEDQEEKCFTFLEATFGTVNLRKLEKIHEDVDPHHLFACPDCIGYGTSIKEPKKSKKNKKNKKNKVKKSKEKSGKKL